MILNTLKAYRIKRNILHSWLLVMVVILIPELCSSQLQPLSRNDKALIAQYSEEYEKSMEDNSINQASGYLNQIAFLYWEHNDYVNAIDHYEKSLVLNEKLSNENGIAMIQNNLGMLYSDLAEFEKSLGYFEKTLAARRSFKNQDGIVAALKKFVRCIKQPG